MQLTEIDYAGQRPVDGYGPGFFRVAGRVHRGALLLLPSGQRVWGGWDDLLAEEIAAGAGIDILLLGCGAEISAVPAGFRQALETAAIGVEQMGSPAACRSYNMLLAEGRRVGLAAFPMPGTASG